MIHIDLSSHWSNLSMLFFIILGLYCVIVIYKVKQLECRHIINVSVWNLYCISFVLILTIFATFRLVNHNTGGIDANSYRYMFEHANDPFFQNDEWFLHNDLLFRYFAKLLRYFVSDYHYYFFILYGFNLMAWVTFLKEFCLRRSYYIPCILLVFLYWNSFCALRSNTAMAIMSVAIIFLNRRNVMISLLLAVTTLFVHKIAFLYFMFFPFYYIFSKIKLTKARFVITMLIVIALGSVIQRIFLDLTENIDFGGSYNSYASRSLTTSFWDNGWKIAFEQMLLGSCMWLYNKKIKIHMKLLNNKESGALHIIWMMCLFDMMTIPINYIMGVWRGYTFFYLPRIVMWCEILYLFNKSQNKRLSSFFNFIFITLFISWLVFRFYNMWQSSRLMPYIFEPLIYI